MTALLMLTGLLIPAPATGGHHTESDGRVIFARVSWKGSSFVQRPKQATHRRRPSSTAARITAPFAVLSVITLIACNSGPTTPSAPSVPVVTGVDLMAPSTMAPGTTTQLRLIARRSDGTSEDVTATARFYSAGRQVPDPLVVAPNGLAEALTIGDTTVIGQTETMASTREVVVVPDGTFRVVGQVVEDGTSNLAVGGVRVEVDGVSPDTTDLLGRFRLYGVPGQARLRVSKDGYTTKELTLAISGHHTENVGLALSAPRADVAGLFQVTFEASPECRDTIPEMLLTRRYAMAMTQSGAAIRAVLSGANLGGGGNPVVLGRAEQTGAVLEFREPGYDDFEPSRVFEMIDPTTFLAISGVARLSPVGPDFSGTLDGSFTLFGGVRYDAPVKVRCSSRFHRVTLTR